MRDEVSKIAVIHKQYPDETAMPDATYDALVDAQRERDMAKAQVVALVWGLGLDKDPLKEEGGGVDDCLRAAGLVHLCDETNAAPVAAASVAG